MSCTCICDYDADGLTPSFKEETFPAAKKEWKCCECGGTIRVGEQHQSYHAVWDGEWNTYRTCMTCYRIRDEVCGGYYLFGVLRDTIWDCLDMDYVTGETYDDFDDDEDEE